MVFLWNFHHEVTRTRVTVPRTRAYATTTQKTLLTLIHNAASYYTLPVQKRVSSPRQTDSFNGQRTEESATYTYTSVPPGNLRVHCSVHVIKQDWWCFYKVK